MGPSLADIYNDYGTQRRGTVVRARRKSFAFCRRVGDHSIASTDGCCSVLKCQQNNEHTNGLRVYVETGLSTSVKNTFIY